MMRQTKTVVRLGRGGLGCASLMALTWTLGCDTRSDGRQGPGGGIGLADDGGSGEGADASDDGTDEPEDPPNDGEPDDGEPADADPTPELPFDPGQLDEVCARNNADRVAQALCNGTQLSSIADLRAALDFASPFFALTGNSSSLVARNVSPINPRLVVGERLGVFTDEFEVGGVEDTLALGFARGEQLVELMGFDPVANELNFYLLKFEQSCNDAPEGCSTADLVTPAIEQNWTRWTLYQDIDLANTTLDCMTCHQPLGPGTPKVPRVQEVSNSWTHWFPVRPPDQGGGWSSGGNGTHGIPVADEDNHGTRSSEVLWSMFERMHGIDGSYGGVAIEEIRSSASGPDLETFVRTYIASRDVPPLLRVPDDHGENGGTMVSDYFCDSPSMELFGEGAAWQQEFQRVLSGARLPLPSHRIDITSEPSREAAIQSYLDVATGLAAPETLVDPLDVIADDTLTEMSLLPRPEASAQEILTHMCSRCHNSNLDSSLSRARFDTASLASLTAADKAVIYDRLLRDHDDKHLMPPPRFGTLPDWALDRVLTWLEP